MQLTALRIVNIVQYGTVFTDILPGFSNVASQ